MTEIQRTAHTPPTSNLPVGPQASFVFSLDTELAWGSVHRPDFSGRERDFDRTREAIHDVLKLFEEYEIHGTWAIVGHLFLEGAQAVDGVMHPEIVRPSYSWLQRDWFARVPSGSAADHPWWYAPDIIRSITGCKVTQEVACHSFAHIIANESECSREAFESDIEACLRLADARGVKLRSFVYPRNTIGHVAVLAEHGFTSYRGVPSCWRWSNDGLAARFARLIDQILPTSGPVDVPRDAGGIVNIPGGCNYLHRSGWARNVPIWVRVRKSMATLRKASRTGRICHLWVHPFNIASDPHGLVGGLKRIFEEYARLRDAGKIQSRTMAQVAHEFLQQQALLMGGTERPSARLDHLRVLSTGSVSCTNNTPCRAQ